MDSEALRRAIEDREPTSWVRAVPFAVVGLVVTPLVMALTGMPEGDRSDLLLFAGVAAVTPGLAGYVAGLCTTHCRRPAIFFGCGLVSS